MSMSKLSTLSLAAEAPATGGFAEQFRDMTAASVNGPCDEAEADLETDGEVEVSTDPAVETRIHMANLTQSCGWSPKTWNCDIK